MAEEEPDKTAVTEETPLITTVPLSKAEPPSPITCRQAVFAFLEAQTAPGRWYEKFTILLILASIVSFVTGTLFLEEYNPAEYAKRDGGACDRLCDALWFGNYPDNGLEFLGLGTTSVLEIFIVFSFSIDYLLRVWTADLEDEKYSGFWGRVRYIPTFYSLVDLASTVPFYVDAFILTESDIAGSQFLRMFRLFRMMRVEGRYDTALTMFDDVFYEQRGILGTALFVGMTTWATVSSLYYLVERRNHGMIYCGAAPDYCGDPDDIDVTLCEIDHWGFTDCSAAGCPPSDDYPEPCYNLFRSIPSASYYSLLNLFGEFPLVDMHSTAGMFVGTLVAIVAVAVFALPAGIIGNGFEDLLSRRREERRRAEEEAEEGMASNEPKEDDSSNASVVGDEGTTMGRLYNFLHAQKSRRAVLFDHFINFLVLSTTITFMLDTADWDVVTPAAHAGFDYFELFAVLVFTGEYVCRIYAAGEDPKYRGLDGRLRYAKRFLPTVDLLSVAPYWIEFALSWHLETPYGSDTPPWSTFVKCLRLLRLLRFEKYTHAFTTFDDVISRNLDVFAVTGFTALIMWIFFSAILYYTERDNPDDEMNLYYNTVPNAMWMTLLNLSGESPLCMYSVWGKILTGIIGLFASGLFGIPIGVLGAGFEEIIEEEQGETPDDEEEAAAVELSASRDEEGDEEEEEEEGVFEDEFHHQESWDASFARKCYRFVNGIGSKAAVLFEISIYLLIVFSVFIGIVQTVKGYEEWCYEGEWVSVVVFTVEYVLRFVGAPKDPDFARLNESSFVARVRYVFSFYSFVDLLAIVPFYAAEAMPGSWADDHDEQLRILRLLRLIKLDKYVPSITLIDDVLRLKRDILTVACYAAVTLWIVFSSLLYLAEYQDYDNGIDDVPEYGCATDCTMAARWRNMFDSLVYTCVHLTGDYPIVEYNSLGRVTCFFMVIAAVGVVSVPSGVIASGFAEIVQGKSKARGGERAKGGAPGDDWYEESLSALQGVGPPRSKFGPKVDEWQTKVNAFLNGTEDETTGETTWTPLSYFFNGFFMTVIVLNVLAVIVESVPEVDSYVGDQAGNFFAEFEMYSVFIFAAEYIMRLFSAPKNREALYSTWVYATTFFGIVDFLSTAPWFLQQLLIKTGHLEMGSNHSKIFRIFRIFRILQLEGFVTAFSKLDNVFRASKDVLKATGLMAAIIWVGCGALFFMFEENNPNWRQCDSSIPLSNPDDPSLPGCYDFNSTAQCNDYYGDDTCSQAAFTNIPNSLFFTAVFLVGEWGLIDFTWPGRFVCMFLCVVGIALYAIPTGTLFDSFGAVLGLVEEDEEEEDDGEGNEEEDEK